MANPIGPVNPGNGTVNGSSFLWTPPVIAAIPPALAALYQGLDQVSTSYGVVPSVDGLGYPNADAFTASRVQARTNWGRYAIMIGGVDMTFFRGKMTFLADIAETEPYGYDGAEIDFKAIKIWETRGVGDLACLVDDSPVEIWHINPDGSLDPTPRFEGFISEWGRKDGTLVVQCLGVAHELDTYVRAPALSDVPVDIGTVVPFQFNPFTRLLDMAQMAPVATGVNTIDRGAWDQGVLTYVSRQLAKTVDHTGNQWTIYFRYPRTGYMTLKDLTTVHWTFWAGSEGVKEDFTESKVGDVNVWYATGQDEAGTAWANSFPSDDGVSVFYQPLVYDPEVHPYDEVGDGTLSYHPDRIVRTKRRVEGYANLGQGITIDEARVFLQAELDRVGGSSIVGTLKVTIDPPEGSRRDIRVGQNAMVKNLEGSDVLMHINKVDNHDPMGKAEVTLTMDSRGRDADIVQSLMDRLNNQLKGHLKSLLVGKGSVVVQDSFVPWDTQAGSGWCPRKRKFDGVSVVHVPAATWVCQRILAGEEIHITVADFQATTNDRYGVYFFNRYPQGMDRVAEYQTFPGSFPGSELPIDPFAFPIEDPLNPGSFIGPWDGTTPQGMFWGVGQAGQGAGYFPGAESNGNPKTGHWKDESGITLSHKQVPVNLRDPAYMWILFWSPDSDIDIQGRIFAGAQVIT